MVREIREKLSEIPGANIEIGQPISHRIDAMLSGTEAQIAIKLFGDDLNKLFALGTQIKSIISEQEGVVDVNIEQQIERPEIAIRPNRQLLARYGVTMESLRNTIETSLAGTAVSQVYEDGIPYDISLMLEPGSRSSLQSISDLLIDTPQGKVPLSDVAKVASTSGPNTINRENVKRRIVISANVEGGDLRGVVNKIQDDVAQR